MKLFKIGDARPGQKVAKDVMDLKGMLVYKAGSVLDADAIQRIQTRKISHIFLDVADDPSAPGASVAAGVAVSRDAELDRVFSDVKSNPIMAALCEAAKLFFKNKGG